MTTIVYRDDVMAADTRSCRGSWIGPQRTGKIVRLKDGGMLGICGEFHFFVALQKHIDDGAEIPDLSNADVSALRVLPDGALSLYEGNAPYPVCAPFFAIGSGCPVALGALHMGATARQAVEIAMLVDPYTGGEIDELRLDAGKPDFGGWMPCAQCSDRNYCESQLMCRNNSVSRAKLLTQPVQWSRRVHGGG